MDPLDAIAQCAPALDRDWNGEGWKPSELATIAYCVLATGPNPRSAREYAANLIHNLGGEAV